jgi:aspartate ammonia-lyase
MSTRRHASSSFRHQIDLQANTTRREHDLLGELDIPSHCYFGVQTLRAVENFPISGVTIGHYPHLVQALAMVKQAAARTNHQLGLLPTRILKAIDTACTEIIEGQLHDQFVVDLLQGGAGTSTNMNANEVIANRALELLGHDKGDYAFCDPHDHVNCSQSTNDAYPTALHIAVALGNDGLMASLKGLITSFARKGRQFRNILKMGRTQLQDAVPMTLGQEFDAFAQALEDQQPALRATERALYDINMGGTAIGTGLNAPKGYARSCAKHLARIVGKPFRPAANLVEATSDTNGYVIYASALKALSVQLGKICNDLRLLSSGPRCGFGDIRLPARQPGSSIMPGKVNPVIPEVVNQVCYRVIGNDVTVMMAAEAGQLQLNAMEPVIITAILESQWLLKNAMDTLRLRCVDGIAADELVCRSHIERSIGIVTALNPHIGYDAATELAAEALRSGRGVVELVRERQLLTDAQIRRILDPRAMTGGR